MYLGPELGTLHLQGVGVQSWVPLLILGVGLRPSSPPSFSGCLGQNLVLLSSLICLLLLLGAPNL